MSNGMDEWISVGTGLPVAGEMVDVWVTGPAYHVEFWCAPYIKTGRHKSGRITSVRLEVDGHWRPCGGLLPAISPELTVTHWRKPPASPKEQHNG
jgi:hypothetical protein